MQYLILNSNTIIKQTAETIKYFIYIVWKICNIKNFTAIPTIDELLSEITYLREEIFVSCQLVTMLRNKFIGCVKMMADPSA